MGWGGAGLPPRVREVVRCSVFSLFFSWAGEDEDVGCSADRKTAVLKRMLAPNNMAIRRLSQPEGIWEATLHKGSAEARGREQLLPGSDSGLPILAPPMQASRCRPCRVVVARHVRGGAGDGGAE